MLKTQNNFFVFLFIYLFMLTIVFFYAKLFKEILFYFNFIVFLFFFMLFVLTPAKN
jgi:energy-coupling factor transporter transmembrane protein EcfT